MKSATQLSLPESSDVCIRRRFVPTSYYADWLESIWNDDRYILLLFSINVKNTIDKRYSPNTEGFHASRLTTDCCELIRKIIP